MGGHQMRCLAQEEADADRLEQVMYDRDQLRDEVKSLKAEVKQWEDLEVKRAVDCCGQEDRAKKAEAELAAVKQARDEWHEKANALVVLDARQEKERDTAVLELKKLHDAVRVLMKHLNVR